MVFLLRLRTPADRRIVATVFEGVWGRPLQQHRRPSVALDPHTIRIGRAIIPRGGDAGVSHNSAAAVVQSEGLRLETGNLRTLEAVTQARLRSSLAIPALAQSVKVGWRTTSLTPAAREAARERKLRCAMPLSS